MTNTSREVQSPQPKRVHRYKVSFNDEEHDLLLALCAAASKKPGTYLRICGLVQGSRKIIYLTREVDDLRLQLSRIGNNLNQIAHHLNEGHVLNGVDAVALKAYVGTVQDDLNSIRELIIESTRDDR